MDTMWLFFLGVAKLASKQRPTAFILSCKEMKCLVNSDVLWFIGICVTAEVQVQSLGQTSYILLAAAQLVSLYVLIREEISFKSAVHWWAPPKFQVKPRQISCFMWR